MEDSHSKKRKTRKKTCEIDTLEKLTSETKTECIKKVDKKQKKLIQNDSQETKTDNQLQISFGKFNITVKKKETMTSEDLREYYDNKFKIDESEKTAKLLVQDGDNNEIFEPIMEDDVYVKNEIKKIERAPSRAVYKVLDQFSDLEIWPNKTNILCWWCCHSFDGIPVPCPFDYDEIRKRYLINGIFCSWSCSAAYSIKEYANLSLIYQMRNEYEPDLEQNDIIVALPKFCLGKFGGSMTIEEYRALDKTKTYLISTEGLSYVNTEIVDIRT